MNRSFSIVVLILVFAVRSALSAPLNVQNHSFEFPDVLTGTWNHVAPDGWVGSGSPFGVWDISPHPLYPEGAPHGDQVGYLHAASITQTLGSVWTAATRYTLVVDFSHDINYPTTLTVELLADGIVLASSGPLVPAVFNVFDTSTLVFETGQADPQLGVPIGIRLTSSNTESVFDNVRLDARPACLQSIDSDSDGVNDSVDNCVAISNPAQRDTDADGIGNLCDPDVAVTNDCAVNFLDLNLYRANFFQAGDLDTDNNGDGQTNFTDLSIVRSFFFGSPGPSCVTNICEDL